MKLSENEFSKYLHTKFRVNDEPPAPVELELVEVSGYPGTAVEQSGMERFSVFFKGPGDRPLPQRTYLLAHERMGEFEIFLVPLAHDPDGFRYEAVFNYFKQPSTDSAA